MIDSFFKVSRTFPSGLALALVVAVLGLPAGGAEGATAPQPAAKDALIYRGPGSCSENCSEVFVELVQRVGLNPRFVGPRETDPAIFENAAVWIQPGGEDLDVSARMKKDLKAHLKAFVAGGGAYVGFCAGGFFAIDDLELLDGQVDFYDGLGSREAAVIPITWNGTIRCLYWEEGPVFFNLAQTVEVFATYPDGRAAGIRTAYGQGRVVVVGPHPEAPPEWRTDQDLDDPDGLDYDLVDETLGWAMGRPPQTD